MSSSPGNSMAGRVCVVTGATSGIGEVTARELARLGASVVIVGRNRERCVRTMQQIRAETGNPNVDFSVADLSSQAEVRRLAEEIQKHHAQIHVLVNNAGGIFTRRDETVDGLERTLAVNHLAYFLLTHLLQDTLRASGPARIVNVASAAHASVRGIDFDDIQNQKRYRGFRVYCQSKLANLLFTYELARRLAGTNVTVNALHPGFVATNIFSGPGALGWIVRTFGLLIALRPEEGAKTSIYLASSPDVEGVTGQYFDKCKPAKSSPASHDVTAARRLWDLSAEMTHQSVTRRS